MIKPILVTGAHRSGTTWTGRIIASAKEVYYLQEPFNISRYPDSPFDHWFEHIDGSSADHKQLSEKYLKSFYLKYHSKCFQEVLKTFSFREGRNYFESLQNWMFKRPLIKDPIAIMSAEWLYNEFNCDVIVCIRHPAAFVASIREKNWHFDFTNFSNQTSLMETYLKNHKQEIHDYCLKQKDIIDQGILLWNIIYSIVWHLKNKYGNKWFFVTNEELSDDPIQKFKEIFDFLKLNFNKEVENIILSTSQIDLKVGVNRDSIKNKNSWKDRLTPEEITDIRMRTEHVWRNFYSDTDWV